MKHKNVDKQIEVYSNLTAQNALDEALRLTDYEVWKQQTSLSTTNAFNNIKIDMLSLQPQLLTYLFKTYGILGKVVEIPVEDAYRYGGFEIDAETISEEELKQLSDSWIRSGDCEQLKQARKWARLFGGGALIAQDGQKLSQPLNKELLYKRDLKFTAVDRWQLCYSEGNVAIAGGTWTLTNYQSGDLVAGEEIHPSRVKILHGKRAPFIIDQQVQGWGISVYEQIMQDMNQFFKSRDVLFELLDEAKTDVLKLATLPTALASAQGERKVQKMVDLIARNKNYKSQITLSTEDEYEQKQMSFGGIADIFKEIRVMMAGSANMPVNKLWGEGVTGFGSGEDSLENYNAQIESEVRALDVDAIYWMLGLRCWHMFGREVEDIAIDWRMLRVLSSIDEQNIDDKKVENILKLYDRQLLTPQEAMELLKRDGIIVSDTAALRGEMDEMREMQLEQQLEQNDKD